MQPEGTHYLLEALAAPMGALAERKSQTFGDPVRALARWNIVRYST